MDQIALYLGLAPFAVLCLTICAVFMSGNRKDHRFGSLTLFMLAVNALIILSVLELHAGTPETLLWISRLSYVTIASMPVFWFLFCVEYALGQPDWYNRRLVGLVLLVPVATVILFWTDSFHHLVWQANEIASTSGRLVNRVLGYGPWFWVHFGYCYTLYFCGASLIVRDFFYQNPRRRRQTLLTLAGVTLPLGFNLLYVFRLLPGLVRDFSPLVMAVSGPLFVMGIYLNKLYGFSMLGRREILGQIREGLVLVDQAGYILDQNQTAGRLLGLATLQPLQVESISPGLWPALQLHDHPDQPLRLAVSGKAGQPLELEAQRIVINRQQHKGWLLKLRDAPTLGPRTAALDRIALPAAGKAAVATPAGVEGLAEALLSPQGTGGPCPAGPGLEQQGDLPEAVHFRQHGQDPHPAHPAQDRGPQPPGPGRPGGQLSSGLQAE